MENSTTPLFPVNLTATSDQATTVATDYFSLVLWVATMIVGGVCNLLLCVTIGFGGPSLKTAMNTYVLGVGLVDLMTCLLFLPLRITVEGMSVSGDDIPKGLINTELLARACTELSRLLLMQALSVERYQAIARPFSVSKVQGRRRAMVIVAMIWAIATMLAGLTLGYFCDTVLLMHCDVQEGWGDLEMYVELPLTLATILSIVLSYSLILTVLRHQRQKMADHNKSKPPIAKIDQAGIAASNNDKAPMAASEEIRPRLFVQTCYGWSRCFSCCKIRPQSRNKVVPIVHNAQNQISLVPSQKDTEVQMSKNTSRSKNDSSKPSLDNNLHSVVRFKSTREASQMQSTSQPSVITRDLSTEMTHLAETSCSDHNQQPSHEVGEETENEDNDTALKTLTTSRSGSQSFSPHPIDNADDHNQNVEMVSETVKKFSGENTQSVSYNENSASLELVGNFRTFSYDESNAKNTSGFDTLHTTNTSPEHSLDKPHTTSQEVYSGTGVDFQTIKANKVNETNQCSGDNVENVNTVNEADQQTEVNKVKMAYTKDSIQKKGPIIYRSTLNAGSPQETDTFAEVNKLEVAPTDLKTQTTEVGVNIVNTSLAAHESETNATKQSKNENTYSKENTIETGNVSNNTDIGHGVKFKKGLSLEIALSNGGAVLRKAGVNRSTSFDIDHKSSCHGSCLCVTQTSFRYHRRRSEPDSSTDIYRRRSTNNIQILHVKKTSLQVESVGINEKINLPLQTKIKPVMGEGLANAESSTDKDVVDSHIINLRMASPPNSCDKSLTSPPLVLDGDGPEENENKNVEKSAGGIDQNKESNPINKEGLQQLEVANLPFSEGASITVTSIESIAPPPNISGEVCLMNSKNKELGRRRVEMKAALKVGLLFLCFLLLWVPLPLLVSVARVQSNGSTMNFDILRAVSALAASTAAVDPILYGLLNRQIRAGMIQTLKKARRKLKQRFGRFGVTG